MNKDNGKLGGAPKGNQNARKKKKHPETEETSQNNPNTPASDFSTEKTEGLKKQAKTTENNIDMICNDVDMIKMSIRDSHNVSAPIFVDNAESINEFIPVVSQLVKLVVTTEDFKVE